MEKIGAYYQCYKNRKSLNFVLSNYRRYYPDCNVVLVCDGGDDFTEESIKYECKYIHDSKIETEKNLIFKSIESARIFIDRLSKNIHHISENFFILLEDDVYIMDHIKCDLLNDINGCNTGEFFSESISSVINERSGTPNSMVYYGSFGGCILRTNFFKELFKNKEKIKEDIEVYFKKSNMTEWASDKILTFLCLINGGKIGAYEGLCETWYPDIEKRLEANSVEILHQYKEHY